jgi:hypothetical protein
MARRGDTQGISIIGKMSRKMVHITSAGQLLSQHGVSSIGFLKIDTEGMDNKIMHSALNYFEGDPEHRSLPLFIEFENNFDPSGYVSVAQRLLSLKYRIYDIRFGASSTAHDMTTGTIHNIVLAEREFSSLAGGEARGIELSMRLQGMIPRHLELARAECSRYFNVSVVIDQASRVVQSNLPFPCFCSLLYRTLPEDLYDELLSVKDSFVV